jgi:Tol biopolymer transport system component
MLGPIIVVAAWFVAERFLVHGLGFTPVAFHVFLVLGWIPFLIVALLVKRVRRPRLRWELTVPIAVAALLTPVLAGALVPSSSKLTTTPLPGRPTLAVSASPHGEADLFLVRDGGAQIIQLTDTRESELMPSLSSDGRSIVFVSDASGTRDLAVMQLDASGLPVRLTALTDDLTWEDEPQWSPDGSRIAFSVRTAAGSDIAVMDADGSHRTYLTDDHTSMNPSWSPDGTLIAFRRPSVDPPADDDIWVMRADGSHAHDLIPVPGPQWGPSWSPDGRRLAFSGIPNGNPDVLIVRSDGSGLANLTDGSPDLDVAQGWTTDGHMLFLSDRSHTGGTFLYFMDADGSAVTLSVIL